MAPIAPPKRMPAFGRRRCRHPRYSFSYSPPSRPPDETDCGKGRNAIAVGSVARFRIPRRHVHKMSAQKADEVRRLRQFYYYSV